MKTITKNKYLITLFFFLLLMGKRLCAIQVYPRIFTPNDDGYNDKVLFQVTNDALLPLTGEVFDTLGRKIGDMVPGPSAMSDESLVWDGKKGGRAVPGGIYIYQIQLGDEIMKGTVIVYE